MTCEHLNLQSLSSGLMRCSDCGRAWDDTMPVSPLASSLCPSCLNYTPVPRIDGGSWRHECGAILKVNGDRIVCIAHLVSILDRT